MWSPKGINICMQQKNAKTTFLGFNYITYLDHLIFLDHPSICWLIMDPWSTSLPTAAPRWASMPSCAQTWDWIVKICVINTKCVCIYVYEFVRVVYHSKKGSKNVLCTCIYVYIYTYIHTNRTQIEYLYLMPSTHKLNFKLHFRRTIATGNRMHCFSGFHAVPYCYLDHLGAALFHSETTQAALRWIWHPPYC